MPASSQTSPLFTLPLEVRQLIYSYIYNGSMELTFTVQKGTQIWKGPACCSDPEALALLVTCRALYREVLPFVYAPHRFHIAIHGRADRQRGVAFYAGPLDRTNTLLRSIRTLEIALHVGADGHVDVVLRKLRVLAAALGEEGEEGAALLKTWRVAVTVGEPVTRQFVAGRIAEVVKQLDEEEKKEAKGGGVDLKV
ncbi:hypothetical protein BDY17DRAFT_319858 [Neohortaea acidophila]|uniref:Uncharacterized protein n=1 Tax=Neohortaea acidophila TaxID=245834 RepID=A0A6A6Q7E9_9PEZI|nr:uncharacterized protein BDY17DRAFT_319858 [Neohortaea acidophila]KAF2487307.1 hypothetical protein BDY17DRAFT_319858 [Neohortaea acidophila]